MAKVYSVGWTPRMARVGSGMVGPQAKPLTVENAMSPTSAPQMTASLDQLVINTIRTLSIDAIQKANSGHPGLPMGAAPMAQVLFQRHLKFDPENPQWFDRDRFILSPGHGSMLLYSLLHLYGYDMGLDEIRDFRQWDAATPGHPEYGVVPGCEATTGPLGQGSANSVGMAIAERYLASRFNVDGHAIVDHRTWAIVSDGDLMEGVAYEAASLAGHLGLSKLTWLYDANDVTLDGELSESFSEDVAKRHEASGWHVLRVEDGDNDLDGIDQALTAAKQETERPTLIIVKTTIGFGSPNKSGKSSSHGSPLGDDEITATKAALGWPYAEPFTVPAEARAQARKAVERGQAAHADWKTRHSTWSAARPELEAQRRLAWAN
ncbi:MAG: transketolase, partial [Planctomycetota bacterium]